MEQTFPSDMQTVKTLYARKPPWKLNCESRACARHNNSDREGRCSSFLEMIHGSKEAGDRRPYVADLLLAQPDVSAGPCIWKHSPKQTQEAPVLPGIIHWAITKRPHPKRPPVHILLARLNTCKLIRTKTHTQMCRFIMKKCPPPHLSIYTSTHLPQRYTFVHSLAHIHEYITISQMKNVSRPDKPIL